MTEQENRVLEKAIKLMREGCGNDALWQCFTQATSVLTVGRYDAELGGIFLDAHLEWLANNHEAAHRHIAHAAQALANTSSTHRVSGTMVLAGSTGGARLGAKLNVTSLAAIIAASLEGSRVIKYGNVGNHSPGSSDFWASVLKVPANQLTPSRALATVRTCGLGVIHAGTVSHTFAAVRPARQAASGPTVFNLAAPLTNPMRGDRAVMVVGVFSPIFLVPMARAMRALDIAGYCFSGRLDPERWMDEVSVSGPTITVATHAGLRAQEPAGSITNLQWHEGGHLLQPVPPPVLDHLMKHGQYQAPSDWVVANAALYHLAAHAPAALTVNEFLPRIHEVRQALEGGRAKNLLARYRQAIHKG